MNKHLNLYIDRNNDKIYNSDGEIVGEQRGQLCKLAPFANAPFVESQYPNGWRLDSDEWPIMYLGEILDVASKEQYYECYYGLYIVPLDNDLSLNRCGIYLNKDLLESLDCEFSLSIDYK